jgi:predicted transcriptional regulator
MRDVTTSFRFDRETARLLDLLADRFESNRSMAVRLAVREEARRLGLTTDRSPALTSVPASSSTPDRAPA